MTIADLNQLARYHDGRAWLYTERAREARAKGLSGEADEYCGQAEFHRTAAEQLTGLRDAFQTFAPLLSTTTPSKV
jgi:hypothetical protein